jgi:hypothetical protein
MLKPHTDFGWHQDTSRYSVGRENNLSFYGSTLVPCPEGGGDEVLQVHDAGEREEGEVEMTHFDNPMGTTPKSASETKTHVLEFGVEEETSSSECVQVGGGREEVPSGEGRTRRDTVNPTYSESAQLAELNSRVGRHTALQRRMHEKHGSTKVTAPVLESSGNRTDEGVAGDNDGIITDGAESKRPGGICTTEGRQRASLEL